MHTGRVRWPVPPPWSVPGPTGVFTDGHQRFWDTARRKAGDRDGTKALIGVLLLHRTLPTEAVLAGIDAAVAAGRCDPDLVAVEARRHLDSGRPAAVVPDVPAAAGAIGSMR